MIIDKLKSLNIDFESNVTIDIYRGYIIYESSPDKPHIVFEAHTLDPDKYEDISKYKFEKISDTKIFIDNITITKAIDQKKPIQQPNTIK